MKSISRLGIYSKLGIGTIFITTLLFTACGGGGGGGAGAGGSSGNPYDGVWTGSASLSYGTCSGGKTISATVSSGTFVSGSGTAGYSARCDFG